MHQHDGPYHLDCVVAVLLTSDFETIAEANMLTYCLKLILEYLALIKLRKTEPDLPRPYRSVPPHCRRSPHSKCGLRANTTALHHLELCSMHSASQSTQQMWTVRHHDRPESPRHCVHCTQDRLRLDGRAGGALRTAHSPCGKHGLRNNTTALNHLGLWCIRCSSGRRSHCPCCSSSWPRCGGPPQHTDYNPTRRP